jgi:ABC-2 type transport system permease protein
MGNVISFEVLRTLKKKSFWIASILPLIIIVAVFGIEYFSATNAQTSSAKQAQAFSQTAKIAVLDDSGLVSKPLLAAEHIAVEPTKDAGIAAVQSAALDAFFYYPPDVTTSGIQVYAQDRGIAQTPYSDDAIGLLKQSVITNVSAAVKNSQAVQVLQKDPSVIATTYKNGVVTNDLADLIAPGFFVIAFMLFFILLGPFIMSSTGEEKENRAAEILLTSIKARTLITGKMISILILGIVQAAASRRS